MEYNKSPADKSGMLPGTAVYIGKRPPKNTQIKVHIYDHNVYQVYDFVDLNEIKTAIKNGHNVWLDISGLADNEQINNLCLDFNVHPLIIEDILNTHQRPKLDNLDNYLFIVFKLLDDPQRKKTYNLEQFSILLQQNLLITIRESENYQLTNLYQKLSAKQSLIRTHGIDYLTYLIMDNIIDDYFHYVEKTTSSIENMEDLLITKPDKIKVESVYTIKRRIFTMKKTIAPLRDIIHMLLSEETPFIDNKYHIYYRDLHDHSIRLLEMIDLHREMTTNMLNIYLSTINNRMNESMKILTIFASVFIPLSFIAGVYGMNFEFMPELKYRYAYPIVLGSMGLIASLLLLYFKKKKLF